MSELIELTTTGVGASGTTTTTSSSSAANTMFRDDDDVVDDDESGTPLHVITEEGTTTTTTTQRSIKSYFCGSSGLELILCLIFVICGLIIESEILEPRFRPIPYVESVQHAILVFIPILRPIPEYHTFLSTPAHLIQHASSISTT